MAAVSEIVLSPAVVVVLLAVVLYKGASVFGKAVVNENGGLEVIC